MKSDPPIDEIRRVRREISAACDHDPKKLVARYREIQKEQPLKLVNYGAKGGMRPPKDLGDASRP